MPVNDDEPDYKGVTGMQLTVIGQTEFFVEFKSMRNTNKLKAIMCHEAGVEILDDLGTLIQWTIIPKCFPLPMDSRERAHTVKNVKGATHDIPKKKINIKERQGSFRTNI